MPLTFNSPLVTILVFLSLQFHAILGNDSVRTRHQSPADSVADSDTVPVERPSINSTSYPGEQLLFSDDFDEFDLATWQHELTMGGGGNWEFEFYSQTEQANIHSAACLLSFSHLLVRSLCCVVSANNRSNSFVDDSVLYLQPTLTRDLIGEQNVQGGYTMDMWGSSPADMCTGNSFYGCSRTSGAGGNVINPIQSARIRTADSVNIKYGRVEVSALLPTGDWLWPAIWLVPRYNAYGMWPASGEVDIMESRGNSADYSAGGNNAVGSTLHWSHAQHTYQPVPSPLRCLPSMLLMQLLLSYLLSFGVARGPGYGQDPWSLTHATYALPSGQSFHDSFHVFGVKWSATGLYTYIDSDDQHLLRVDFTQQSFWQRGGWENSTWVNPWRGRNNSAPFDQSFYLVLNVAVGGVSDYFPDGVAGKPWKNTDGNSVNNFYAAIDQWLPTWNIHTRQPAMAVDWVKVYQ